MITLANVMTFLKLTDSDPITADEQARNDYIEDYLIPGAIGRLNGLVNRRLDEVTHTEYYDGNGESVLVLKNYPDIVITSIKKLDSDGTFVTMFNDGDTFTNSVTIIHETGMLKFGKGYKLPCGCKNIQVVYKAGYVVTPFDIKQCLLQMTAEAYENSYLGQGNFNISSENMNSQASTSKVYKMPYYTDVVNKYKWTGI